ncbi:MAG TPA: hypothetical protein VJ739_18345 [Gemmataceae bacterium]|nr:hypothetical protein [Gemmataceae bacterium]
MRQLPDFGDERNKGWCVFCGGPEETRDPITIGSRAYPRDDVLSVLGSQLESLPRNFRDTRRVPLGVYRGLRFGLILHPHFLPAVYLEGAATRQSMLSREHQGPRAVLNVLERLASGYGSDCNCVRQDLVIAEAQLRDHQVRLGKPFSHDAYLSELTTLRDGFKTSLSGIAKDAATEPQLGARELAESIKALKASQIITAMPAARWPPSVLRGGANHRTHPPQDGADGRFDCDRSSRIRLHSGRGAAASLRH